MTGNVISLPSIVSFAVSDMTRRTIPNVGALVRAIDNRVDVFGVYEGEFAELCTPESNQTVTGEAFVNGLQERQFKAPSRELRCEMPSRT